MNFRITQLNSVAQSNWESVASSSNGNIILVGTGSGRPRLSTDAGSTWTQLTTTGATLPQNGGYYYSSSFSSSDGSILATAAYGSNDYIYMSTNSGTTWSSRTGSGSRQWRGLAGSSTGSILVAGAYSSGYLYISSDSGVNWIANTAVGLKNWYGTASSSDGIYLAAVADNSYIHTSTDSGANWVVRTNAGSRRWWSITSSADGTKLAASVWSSGNIYTSTDSGVTWIARTVAGTRSWTTIRSDSTGDHLIAGVSDSNVIYASTDAGVSWSTQTMSGISAGAGIYALYINSYLGHDTALVGGRSNSYVYTAEFDFSGPTAGAGDSTLTTSSVAASTITVNWTAASDDITTTAANLQYLVYRSTSNNIQTLADVKANGTPVGSYTANITSKAVTGLSASTTYYFNVLVKDEAGNESAYTSTSQQTTADTYTPTLGNSTLTVSAIDSNNATVNWTAASDDITTQANLQYLVYRSTSNNIQTLTDVKANGTPVGSYTANITSKAVTGLSLLTTYYFNVLVKDEAGNESAYTSISITTSPANNYSISARSAVGNRRWIQQAIATSDDGTKIVAGPFGGYIYTSTDSGSNWVERTNFSKNWFIAASSADGTKLAFATFDEYIYTSTDSGVNWLARTQAGSRNWRGLTSSSDGAKLAATSSTYIYTSTDSGSNWVARTLAGSANWNRIAGSSDGTRLIAACTASHTAGVGPAISSDSGVTWTNVPALLTAATASGDLSSGMTDGNWTAVASSSNGANLFAGSGTTYGSYLYTSTNYGSSWARQTSPGQQKWRALTCDNDGSTVVGLSFSAGYENKLFTSIDSGVTWTSKTIAAGITGYLGSIETNSDGYTLLIGVDSTISNNSYIYSSQAIMPDVIAPTVGDSGNLSFSSVSSSGLTVSWMAATDDTTSQANLQYLVYRSTSNNLSSVANIEANGTAIGSYTANITSKAVTGLSDSTTYFFNVIVKDEAGNKTAYVTHSQQTSDGTTPTAGNSGNLSFSSVSASGLTISWTAATDNVSSQAALEYLVYRSTSNNLSSVANIEANGTAIGSYAANITSKAVTGLSSSTTYYFNVIVKDEAGNKTAYVTHSQQTSDVTAPTVGNSGNLSFSSVNPNDLIVNWTAATDDVSSQAALEYLVYRSTSNNLDSVANIEANGTAIGSYTTNITSKAVTSLTDGYTYYFNVIVKDEAGNKAAFASASQATPDGTAPTISNSMLSLSGVTSSSVTVSWSSATDNVTAQGSLEYLAYYSTSSSLSSVNDIELYGTPIGSYTAMNTTSTATGLAENTNYYFNVIVKDAANLKSAYSMSLQVTLSSTNITGTNNIVSGTTTWGAGSTLTLNVDGYVQSGGNLTLNISEFADVTANGHYIETLPGGHLTRGQWTVSPIPRTRHRIKIPAYTEPLPPGAGQGNGGGWNGGGGATPTIMYMSGMDMAGIYTISWYGTNLTGTHVMLQRNMAGVWINVGSLGAAENNSGSTMSVFLSNGDTLRLKLYSDMTFTTPVSPEVTSDTFVANISGGGNGGGGTNYAFAMPIQVIDGYEGNDGYSATIWEGSNIPTAGNAVKLYRQSSSGDFSLVNFIDTGSGIQGGAVGYSIDGYGYVSNSLVTNTDTYYLVLTDMLGDVIYQGMPSIPVTSASFSFAGGTLVGGGSSPSLSVMSHSQSGSNYAVYWTHSNVDGYVQLDGYDPMDGYVALAGLGSVDDGYGVLYNYDSYGVIDGYALRLKMFTDEFYTMATYPEVVSNAFAASISGTGPAMFLTQSIISSGTDPLGSGTVTFNWTTSGNTSGLWVGIVQADPMVGELVYVLGLADTAMPVEVGNDVLHNVQTGFGGGGQVIFRFFTDSSGTTQAPGSTDSSSTLLPEYYSI